MMQDEDISYGKEDNEVLHSKFLLHKRHDDTAMTSHACLLLDIPHVQHFLLEQKYRVSNLDET